MIWNDESCWHSVWLSSQDIDPVYGLYLHTRTSHKAYIYIYIYIYIYAHPEKVSEYCLSSLRIFVNFLISSMQLWDSILNNTTTNSFHIYSSLLFTTLVHRSRMFLPWRWRRYVPPKQCHAPEDDILHSHGCESLKSYLDLYWNSFHWVMYWRLSNCLPHKTDNFIKKTIL
jgi:hypothetical protein